MQLFASDFDGTLVPLDNDIDRRSAASELLDYWQRPERPEVFVVNSGRMADDLRQAVAAAGIPQPDYLIGGVGTEVCDGQGRPVEGWADHLGSAFDSAVVERIVGARTGAELQEAQFQSHFKSSWYLLDQDHAAIAELEDELRAAGLQVHLIYSSRRHLDVLPAITDKGLALAWLCQRLGIPLESVVVAGDTGNDVAMFSVPAVRGIMVANARPELRAAAARGDNHTYAAASPHGFGVLEGLRFFNGDDAAQPGAH